MKAINLSHRVTEIKTLTEHSNNIKQGKLEKNYTVSVNKIPVLICYEVLFSNSSKYDKETRLNLFNIACSLLQIKEKSLS